MPLERIPNLQGYTVFGGKVYLGTTLGKGGYGRVFRGETTNPLTGETTTTAVKVMIKAPAGTQVAQQQAMEQVLHLAMSTHPNVVTLRDAESVAQFVLMQLDFCPGGTLRDFMEKNESVFANDDAKVKQTFGQILDAVHHCHKNNVYHRDLKPDNVLMSKDGSKAFLSDFGLATSSAQSTDCCGSKHYKSPECTNVRNTYRPYDHAANDVWALGVILCAMLTHRLPWDAASSADPCYRVFRRNPRWLYEALPLSEDAFALLQAIFDPDPTTRLTLPALIDRVREIETFFRQEEDSSNSPSGLAIMGLEGDMDGLNDADEILDVFERDLSEIQEIVVPIVQRRKRKKWREKMSVASIGTILSSPFRRLRRLSDS